MDKNKNIETVDDYKLGTYWRDIVNIGAQYEGYCQQRLESLTKFQKYGIDSYAAITWSRTASYGLHQTCDLSTLPCTALDQKHANSRSKNSTNCC